MPGLITLLLVSALALITRGGAIEADLTDRAAALFVEDGTPWASAVLDGRDATLSGTAPTEAALDAAIAAGNRVWGVFRLDTSGLELLPLADPYTLSFEKQAGSVTVSGTFPNGQVRAGVLDSVRADLGDLALVDETTLARGAPLGFADQAAFAGAGLGALATGVAALDGQSLSVSGTAADLESYDAELARLGAPLDGLGLGEIAIEPPLQSPFTWSADETDGGVTLSGFVPSEDARTSIVSAAEALGTVDDQMMLASGAPDGFVAAADALLSQMQSLDAAAASIEDGALTLSGDAPTSAAFDSANAFLGALPEGFGSLSGRIAPPIADPFSTVLEKTGDAYTLTGVLPNETTRAVLLDALSGQGVMVDDQTTIARGAAEGVDIAATMAASAASLAGLVDGTADLTGAALSITGAAPTLQSAVSAETDIAALALPGVNISSAIEAGPASPFTFAISTDETTISLDGYVPSEDKRASVLADVAALFPGFAITDNLIVAEGAPAGFDDTVLAGLRGLGRLEGGAFSLSDSDVSLTGQALYDGSASRIEGDLMAALPDGMALTSDIGLLPPPQIVDDVQCQLLFARALADNTIRFGSGSAAIDPLSFGLLDRLVRTLQSCPDASVEIGGHTDSDGSDTLNQSLSEQRAQAVLGFVIDAGIDATRVAAVGYGETDPIADNATEEGRAQNRRIEFTVERQPEPVEPETSPTAQTETEQ
ncbi:MAG: OmpA family protein [Devosiaceae bacterium]|nr:OmpA family protein [Devosiaceae bacterium MH13]